MSQVTILGRGVAVAVDEKTGKILIELDPNVKGVESKSGKSTVLASTMGNQSIAIGPGKIVKLGLNLFR
jgi:hypothetical protein